MRHFHVLKNRYHCPVVNLDKLWSLVPETVFDAVRLLRTVPSCPPDAPCPHKGGGSLSKSRVCRLRCGCVGACARVWGFQVMFIKLTSTPPTHTHHPSSPPPAPFCLFFLTFLDSSSSSLPSGLQAKAGSSSGSAPVIDITDYGYFKV